MMMKPQPVPTSDVELTIINDAIEDGPIRDCEADAPAITPVIKSNSGYEPVAPTNSPAIITWQNLTVTTIPKRGQEPKKLLNNLSGIISGGLWAIMGGSGSGKTTFLSTVALRLDTNRMRCEGKVLLNGRTYDKALLKAMSGYVMQDDLLISTLTVAETLNYTALLRTPKNLTNEERLSRQDTLLEMLGISHVKNVRIGDTRNKGISGGERKRLCVAMELLCRPSLLFLDEPTSGLDSATSYSLLLTLKKLSMMGECTIITTIHQPQSKIFATFDNLILMKKGYMCYQGASSKACDYYESLGYPLPPSTNPADHLIGILSENDMAKQVANDKREAAKRRLTIVDNSIFQVTVDTRAGLEKPDFKIEEGQSWFYKFYILLERNCKNQIRRWDNIFFNLILTVTIALFAATTVWRDMDDSKKYANSRRSFLFFCTIHQGVVASIQGTYGFPVERALMLRERQAGTYGVSNYYLAKSISDMMFQIMYPFLFAVIVYPMTGLQPGAQKFFTFAIFLILDSFSATSLANAISCVCVGIELSTVMAALGYEWTRLFGGFFMSPVQVQQFAPQYEFAQVMSFMRYCFYALTLNEHDGIEFNCKPSELNSDGQCVIAPLNTPPYTGSRLMDYYGYDRYTIAGCAGALVSYIIITRLLGYLGLRYFKW